MIAFNAQNHAKLAFILLMLCPQTPKTAFFNVFCTIPRKNAPFLCHNCHINYYEAPFGRRTKKRAVSPIGFTAFIIC